MSIASESSLGVSCWMSVRNLARTIRQMRDERWESGWGALFWWGVSAQSRNDWTAHNYISEASC